MRQDSLFSLGYAYEILRNDDVDDDEYQDFDRHQASLSLDHRLNREWKASLGGQYVRGLFDEPDDDMPELPQNMRGGGCAGGTVRRPG